MQITSDFESIALQCMRFQRQFLVLRIRFWGRLCVQKILFRSFLLSKNAKIVSFAFSFTEWFWEKKWLANSYWIKKFDTSVSINQLFHNYSVFEWKKLKRVRFWFNNTRTHHVLKFNSFFKIKFCHATRFRKENVNFQRKNFKGSFSVLS